MIDNESYIRQLKIDLITNGHNPIIVWFDVLWDELMVIGSNIFDHPCASSKEEIYYINGEINQWIFFIDVDMGRFYVNDVHFWEVFYHKFEIGFELSQKFTSILVEYKLNMILPTPVDVIDHIDFIISRELN